MSRYQYSNHILSIADHEQGFPCLIQPSTVPHSPPSRLSTTQIPASSSTHPLRIFSTRLLHKHDQRRRRQDPIRQIHQHLQFAHQIETPATYSSNISCECWSAATCKPFWLQGIACGYDEGVGKDEGDAGSEEFVTEDLCIK